MVINKERILCYAMLCFQWPDKAGHKETLTKLGGLFKNNFEGFVNYKGTGSDTSHLLTDEILAAGPNLQ